MVMPKYNQDNQDQQIIQSKQTYDLCMAGIITKDNAMESLWRNYSMATKLRTKITIANKIKFIQEAIGLR